jgi:uncharacterized lipoprotein YmbA
MKTLNQLLFAAGAALLLAGCASSPSKFYTLDATAIRADAPDASYAVIVGPVFVPAAVDRPQFVVTTAPNQVKLEEFNRWASPLGDNIARVVAVNLGDQLGTLHVASAPMPNFGPAYHVAIRIERFESLLGDAKTEGQALLDARWSVSGPKGEDVVSGVFSMTEPSPGGSYDGLAAAHSRLLAKLSGSIAISLQHSVGGGK